MNHAHDLAFTLAEHGIAAPAVRTPVIDGATVVLYQGRKVAVVPYDVLMSMERQIRELSQDLQDAVTEIEMLTIRSPS